MSIKDIENQKNKMIGGAASLTLSVIIVKLLGVLYKIPLASVLSDEGMGYFNSAYTVYSFFYLLCTAGVPKGIMLLLSEHKEDNSINNKGIIKASIRAFTLIGIFTALLFTLVSTPLSHIIGSPESKYTMICIAPSILFTSVAGVLRGSLNSQMRLGAIAASQVLDGALKLALGLLFALIGVKLSLPVYVISALTILGATFGSLVSLIYLIILSKNEIWSLNTRQTDNKSERNRILKKLFKISFPITLSAALMSLTGVVDLFLIMRRLESIGYTEAEATALYGNYTTLAVSMFNLGIALITPVSMAVMPALASAYTKKDKKNFDISLKNALSLSSFISAPIVLGFLIFSEEILRLLFGAEAASEGYSLLVLLSPGIVFMSLILILNSAIESVGRPGLAMMSMTIGAFVKIIISGILLGIPEIGISGAPLGTVISYAVSSLISLLILSHMLAYNIPILSGSLLNYLTAAASVLTARLIYDNMIITVNYTISLIASILAAALIYVILSILFSVTRPEISLKIAKSTKFG